MATFFKFDVFTQDQNQADHDFSTNTFKLALTNTALSASNAVFADITEISAGNGYSAGGATVTVSVSRTGGTTTILGSSVTFTASGGSIGPFRYWVLYNDTTATPNKPLVCGWDNGSNVTLADGQSFVISFNGTNPGNIFSET